MQHLDLTEDESAALVALLTRTIFGLPIPLVAASSLPDGDPREAQARDCSRALTAAVEDAALGAARFP